MATWFRLELQLSSSFLITVRGKYGIGANEKIINSK